MPSSFLIFSRGLISHKNSLKLAMSLFYNDNNTTEIRPSLDRSRRGDESLRILLQLLIGVIFYTYICALYKNAIS